MALLLVASGIIFLMLIGVILYLAVLVDVVAGKEDFATGKLVTKRIIQIIKDRKLDGGHFYDLGSCRGGFASRIARACPNLKVVGIDDNWFRTLCAKARGLLFKNLIFEKQDIFAKDVSKADVVYVYLPRELLPRVQDKLRKELKPGAVVITSTVNFSDWQCDQSFILHQDKPDHEKIFVYSV